MSEMCAQKQKGNKIISCTPFNFPKLTSYLNYSVSKQGLGSIYQWKNTSVPTELHV